MRTAPFKRSQRLAGSIFRIVSEAFYNNLSDPRLKGVQLTDAEMTDDLRLVKVHYYLENENEQKRALKGLNSCKGYLKKEIATGLGLRLTPDIQFFFNKGMNHSEKINRVIEELRVKGEFKDTDYEEGEEIE